MSPWWNHKIGLQDFSGRLPNLKKKKKKKKKYISWLQVQRDNLQALILKAAVGWAILPNDH